MKKLLVLLAFAFTFYHSSGQGLFATFNQPNYTLSGKTVITGQMLNITNAYSGNQLDTINASSTIKLTIAIGGSLGTVLGGVVYNKILPLVAADTFVPWPVFGYGIMTVYASCTKISGAPSITGTLQQSPDGISWYPVRAGTTPGQDTMTVTNVAGVQTYAWEKSIKYSPYMQVALTTTSVTQVSTCKVQYEFTKASQIQTSN